MASVNGFYGHKRKNHVRSLVMFLGFALTLQFTMGALLASPLVLISAYIDSHNPFPTLFDRPLDYFKTFGPGIFCVSIILFYLNYWFHEAITKYTTGYRIETGPRYRQLSNIVAQIAITAGVPVPKIGIMSSQALNAFACGRTPEHATIVFTEGLLQQLSAEELQAVIAHEVAHIANGDMELMAYANASHSLNKWLNFINPFQMRQFKLRFWMIFLFPILFPLLIIAMITGIAIKISSTLANFTRYFIFSSREFIADADAVRLTHNPAALISALRKIEGRSHIHRVDPMTEAMMIDGAVDGEYASHPPIQDRIATLVQYSGSMIHGASTSYQQNGYGAPVASGRTGFGRKRQTQAAQQYTAQTQYRAKASKNILDRLNSDSDKSITGLPKEANIVALVFLCLFLAARGLPHLGIGPGAKTAAAMAEHRASNPAPVREIEYSPAYLAIDLSGHGLATKRIRQSKTYFYSPKTKQRQHTGWLDSNSGFLFYDMNGNKKFSNNEMLTLSSLSAGKTYSLNYLRKYDNNGDGKIDSKDKNYSKFMIWQDHNRDGRIDKTETFSLKDREILAINYKGGEHFGAEGRITASGAKLFTKTIIQERSTSDGKYTRPRGLYLVSFETDLAKTDEAPKETVSKLVSKTINDPATTTQSAESPRLELRR